MTSTRFSEDIESSFAADLGLSSDRVECRPWRPRLVPAPRIVKNPPENAPGSSLDGWHDCPGLVTPGHSLKNEKIETLPPPVHPPKIDNSLGLSTYTVPVRGFVDWLTASWPIQSCPPLLRNGHWVHEGPDGEILRRVCSRTRISSAETSVQIYHHNGLIHFSGNPLKYLTGQNLLGSPDLYLLFQALVWELSKLLGGDVSPISLSSIRISRLDITQMVEADTPEDARAICAALGGVMKTRHRRNDEYVLGKGSETYRIKWYHKGDEARSNANRKTKKQNIELPPELDRYWRFEIELHRKYLERSKLYNAQKWFENPSLVGTTMLDIIDGMDISLGNANPTPSGIAPRDLPLWRSWFSGDNPLQYKTRATAYRIRKRFLDTYGVDLFLHPSAIDRDTLDGGKILSMAWYRLREQCGWMARYPGRKVA